MRGYNRRLPASLASDDLLDSELVHQEASGPVKRVWEIRDAASQAWVRNKDAEMVSSAVRKRTSLRLEEAEHRRLGLCLAGHGQVQRLERTRNHRGLA